MTTSFVEGLEIVDGLDSNYLYYETDWHRGSATAEYSAMTCIAHMPDAEKGSGTEFMVVD